MESTTVIGGTIDAGAVSSEQAGAVQSGAQEAAPAGAVSQESQPAAVESGETETTEGQEAHSATEGKSHKLSLEDRVSDLVEQRTAEFKAEFEALKQYMESDKQARQQANFAPIEVELQAEENIARQTIAMRQLEQDIELAGPDTAEGRQLLRQYFQVQAWVEDATNALKGNRSRRLMAENQAKQKEEEQRFFQSRQADINQLAELKRTTMNVSPEAWAEGRKLFAAECTSNPMIQRQFDDLARIAPSMAVEFAANHIQSIMSERAKALQQKATAKTSTFSVSESGGAATAANFDKVKTWGDLIKLHSKEINEFARQHPKRFEDMKSKHFR